MITHIPFLFLFLGLSTADVPGRTLILFYLIGSVSFTFDLVILR